MKGHYNKSGVSGYEGKKKTAIEASFFVLVMIVLLSSSLFIHEYIHVIQIKTTFPETNPIIEFKNPYQYNKGLSSTIAVTKADLSSAENIILNENRFIWEAQAYFVQFTFLLAASLVFVKIRYIRRWEE